MVRNNTDILPLFQKCICPCVSTYSDVMTDNINTTDYRQLTRIT